jgi:PadR family transcriptional regulator PadR
MDRAIIPVGNLKVTLPMREKPDVLQGTLALMVLKTLDVLSPPHGYGIARRIEQISGDILAANQGTLYPLLLKLEQEGSIASQWGASENNRRARFYRLTATGRKQLQTETRSCSPLWRLRPVIFRRCERCGSICWWRCAMSSWLCGPSPAAATGRKQLEAETWEQTAAIMARFFNVKAEDLA